MDSSDSPTSELIEDSREASVAEAPGGNIGVCVFLTTADLAALGIDADDVDQVTYDIDTDTGKLEISAESAIPGNRTDNHR